MQDSNNFFNNADSFAMAFDNAWRKADLEEIKNLKEEQKIKKVLSLIKDHPFLQNSYSQAEKVAKFRIRLLNL